MLLGEVQPNGSSGVAWFQVSLKDPVFCSNAIGDRFPANAIAYPSTHEEVPVRHALEDLEEGTYYYCAAAQSEVGAAFGQVLSFEVQGEPVASAGCTAVASGAGGAWIIVMATYAMARRRPRRGEPVPVW